MKVLFYMPISYGTLQERIDAISNHRMRGELLYCVNDLKKNGCEIIVPHIPCGCMTSKKYNKNICKNLIRLSKKYDVIYSPYFQGLEWLIYLRALGLFKKKIVIWQHSPIEERKTFLGRIKQKFFYAGCDRLLFFTNVIKELSLEKCVPIYKMEVLDWGPDMGYFDRIRIDYRKCIRQPFLMSGSDSRDFESPIKAFSKIPSINLNLYPPTKNTISKSVPISENIHLSHLEHVIDGYNKMALATANCKCVLIITKPVPGRKLPSGLTSICEAVALGKPCIITDNPYFSDEMRNAGFAIFVKVGDVEGIKTEVMRLENDDELCHKMSAAALAYARKYNSETMAKSLSKILDNL